MSIIHWDQGVLCQVGKTNQERLDAAIAYHETGKSLRECEKLSGINYKSIQREVVKRGVKKGDLSHLVEDKIKLDMELATINPTAKYVIENEADLKRKHIEFFNNAAIQNVTEAMMAGCENQQDFKSRADTILKGKEAVIGKTPDVAVQVNNSLSLEELLKDL